MVENYRKQLIVRTPLVYLHYFGQELSLIVNLLFEYFVLVSEPAEHVLVRNSERSLAVPGGLHLGFP